MEKQKVNKIEKDEITHEFYCDDCGKYIDQSIEWEDGYYESYGDYEQQMFFKGSWWRLEKCLCDDCKNKYDEKITTMLKEIGFKVR